MDYARRTMFVIDENVSELEVLRLRKAGIRVRLIGDEVARTGDADENLLPILLKLKKPVLLTQDKDFFQFKWLHTHSFGWMFIQTLWPILCKSFYGILNLTRKQNVWELWRGSVRVASDICVEEIANCARPSGLVRSFRSVISPANLLFVA